MNWRAYRVRLRLRSPLHVGAGQVGNVQRARPYVTGRALWGALTARLTRDAHPRPQAEDYRTMGQQVQEELAYSYFYPLAEGQERVGLWPWGEEADEFSWLYLGSYAATALDHGRGAALEGSLHEVEYVAPTTRDGRPVCLLGYVFERAGCGLLWRQALGRLQLGGERGYGWGRVSLVGVRELAEGEQLFGCYDLALGDQQPLLQAGQQGKAEPVPLLAHTLACDGESGRAVTEAEGAVEPLVGRETRDASRFGQERSPVRVCWAPGATVPVGLCLQVGRFGLWSAYP